MKAKIRGLNRLYAESRISFDEYRRKVENLLCGLDWQKRIQYNNMLLM